MRISVGRCSAALSLALVLVAGCSSKGSSQPADQGASSLCQDPGDCPRGEPCGCVGTDPGCSCESCQQDGACHATDAFCEPASDDDCNRPGGACAVYGFCHVVMTGAGPRCFAQSEEDCRNSWLCAQWGACAFVPEIMQCSAGSADDCAASAACRELGCCSLVGGECLDNTGSCPYMCCGDGLC
jgi:hypothetical protein